MLEKWKGKSGRVLEHIEQPHGHVARTKRKVALTIELLCAGMGIFWFCKLTLWNGILLSQPNLTELLTAFAMAGLCHTLAKRETEPLTGWWARCESVLRTFMRIPEILLFGYGAFWFFKLSLWDRTLLQELGWAELVIIFAIASACHTFAKKPDEKEEKDEKDGKDEKGDQKVG